MKAIEFVQGSISGLHSEMINDVKGLTQQHLAWKPAPKANPIGFLFWHYMRTEDSLLHDLQGKPSIWESEDWCGRLGIDIKEQGTGFQEAEVEAVAALPLSQVMGYAQRVTQSTEEYLKSLGDADLDHVPDPNRPKRTIGMILRNFILAHGWWHLGEIKYLKGMQGMPAAR